MASSLEKINNNIDHGKEQRRVPRPGWIDHEPSTACERLLLLHIVRGNGSAGPDTRPVFS